MTVDDLRLIVRLVRGDRAGAARRLAAAPGALDRLAGAAEAEGLAVVLLRALRAVPAGVELSDDRRAALESRRRVQDGRHRVLGEALAGLAERFTASGQPFMLLKGPYVADRYYGDSRGREFLDIDLLVPRADRVRASRLLEAAGYERRSRVVGGEALTSFFVHGFDFASGAASVDLHWCLLRHPSVRLDERRLWSARETYALSGRPFAVLSVGHEIVFHGLSLLRDIERGRPKAKNIVDIVQVAAGHDASFDWDGLLDSGAADGTRGPLVNVLSLCLDLADAGEFAPRLSRALERHAARLVPARPAAEPARFAPAWMDVGNRWWAARAYDTTAAAWFLWWLASLPFRVAAHRHHAPAGARRRR
jgi:hypothetical protein